MFLNLDYLDIKCPNCKSQNFAKKLKIINQFTSLEIKCKECNEDYAFLMPTDNHAFINYPFIINLNSLQYKGELNYYTQLFLDNYKTDSQNNKTEFRGEKRKDKCIIVNTLDNAYGHSLLKIFALKNIYEKYGEDYDIVVITQPQFVFLVPDFLNLFIVYKGFNEMGEYFDVTAKLREYLSEYNNYEIVINSTYPYGRNNIKSFFLSDHLNDKVEEKKIVYSYRKEIGRSWGMFLEKLRIKKLFQKINTKYPNEFEFYVIGDLDGFSFPDFIIDERVSEYNKETDIKWINILNEAEMVLGVHGSHMIMPSLLADKTLNLLPKFKYGHIGEDIFTSEIHQNLMMKNIQFLRGGYFLFDLTVNKVFNILIKQIFVSKRKKIFFEFSKSIINNNKEDFYELLVKSQKKFNVPDDKLFKFLINTYKKIKRFINM